MAKHNADLDAADPERAPASPRVRIHSGYIPGMIGRATSLHAEYYCTPPLSWEGSFEVASAHGLAEVGTAIISRTPHYMFWTAVISDDQPNQTLDPTRAAKPLKADKIVGSVALCPLSLEERSSTTNQADIPSAITSADLTPTAPTTERAEGHAALDVSPEPSASTPHTEGRTDAGIVARMRFFIVDPAYHGLGIGTALLRAVLEHVDEPANGIVETRLRTYKHLDAARRLYRRFGFQVRHGEVQHHWGVEPLWEEIWVRPRGGLGEGEDE